MCGVEEGKEEELEDAMMRIDLRWIQEDEAEDDEGDGEADDDDEVCDRLSAFIY